MFATVVGIETLDHTFDTVQVVCNIMFAVVNVLQVCYHNPAIGTLSFTILV